MTNPGQSATAALGTYEVMLIILGTIVLTLVALWMRDSIIERRDARKYRRERETRSERRKD